MNHPLQLKVDLSKLKHNAQRINDMCLVQGIEVAGVVKAACGQSLIAKAILDGGVSMLADSRIDNVRQLQRSGISEKMMMLRLPSPNQAEAVAACCDISLNSESDTILSLSEAAVKLKREHEVLLMLELGDRREGILPNDLLELVALIQDLPNIKLAGLGTNLGCLGGIRTTTGKLSELVRSVEQVEKYLQRPLRYISGGNSNMLPLVLKNEVPERINHIRVGFSILQGKDAYTDKPIESLATDIFQLEAELIEIQNKHSLPDGEVVIDAFGAVPKFKDVGIQARGIVGVGRIDTDLVTLSPVDKRVSVIGASSDHLVIDLTEKMKQEKVQLSDKITFNLGYGALLQAMLSPYVEKHMERDVNKARDTLLVSDIDTLNYLKKDEWLARLDSQHIVPTQIDSSVLLPLITNGKKVVLIHSLPLAILSVPFRKLESDLVWLHSRTCFESSSEKKQDSILYHLLEHQHVFSAKRSCLLGITHSPADEEKKLSGKGANLYTMEDVDLLGVREIVRKVLNQDLAGDRPITLVLDFSVLTGNEFAKGGLTYRELCQILEVLSNSNRVSNVIISSMYLNSERDLFEYRDYIRTICGHRILQESESVAVDEK